MELVIAIAIIGVGLIWYFNAKSKENSDRNQSAPGGAEDRVEATAPYKVEPPQPAKCGCGRSTTGFCVGLHKLTPDEWATHADNPNKQQPKKKPAAKKAPAKKPAAIKAPAKPRAKKAK